MIPINPIDIGVVLIKGIICAIKINKLLAIDNKMRA